jgi:hypothetical protein
VRAAHAAGWSWRSLADLASVTGLSRTQLHRIAQA